MAEAKAMKCKWKSVKQINRQNFHHKRKLSSVNDETAESKRKRKRMQ